ncbi:MAG: 23S rRNA (uracil(1939)-C(5))-methyltransferase RlmD [Oscillospiraceae bacterium]|nr:23S rRNA (uracil(1939)-C(5))-methyltransferase RlmD [Oscillospiraceae bacterium]
MQKNEQLNLTITALSHEGNGIARHNGMAIFIPNTAPGDEVEAKILKTHPNYAYARLESIIKPSPDRVQNDCPAYPRCGGCTLRHLSYRAELAAKENWVHENLARIGKLTPRWDSITSSPIQGRYRNKAQYPVRLVNDKIRAGFFAPRSHTLIPVEDCRLQPAFFADLTREITAFCEEHSIPAYDEGSHSGLLRQICIRCAESSSQTLVCLVLNGRDFPLADTLVKRLKPLCPGPLSFHININRERTNAIFGKKTRHLFGPPAIEDTLCGLKIRLSPQSFYQVNRQAAELLYGTVLEYAAPNGRETLLDLYCGAGAIGLSMASKVKSVIGVEIFPEAVLDAEENARVNGIDNARFLTAAAAQAAGQLRKWGVRPDIALIDPPRKGLDAETIEQIIAILPPRIVYISCNSATLARDAAQLAQKGYKATKGRVVDLFPRTAHVECVLELVLSDR